jgi:hypothetical protein
MATIPHEEILLRLRKIYKDAFHITDSNPADADVLRWADAPELWAEDQIRFRGWSWSACESTIRHCRTYRKRARFAYEAAAIRANGCDPFDPLFPCTVPTTAEGDAQ